MPYFFSSSPRIHTFRKGSCFSLKLRTQSWDLCKVRLCIGRLEFSEIRKLTGGKGVNILRAPLARKFSSCFELAQLETPDLLCLPSCLEVKRGQAGPPISLNVLVRKPESLFQSSSINFLPSMASPPLPLPPPVMLFKMWIL